MKNKNKQYYSLAGKFLIASPNISDPRFSQTLIYMISDAVEGSMGVIINKPAINLNLSNILFDFNEYEVNRVPKFNIHYGGPVEFDKGFVLHSNDYKSDKEKTILKDNLVLSSNIEILKDLSLGKGPSKFIVLIGYSGWSSQQLNKELKENSWLIANVNKNILFSKNYDLKWKNALKTVGLQDEKLQSFKFSNYSGSA